MKLYFAGSFTGVTCDKLRELGVRNKLYSYVNEPKQAVEWGSKGLMLDSGAFSVLTRGIDVNINGLCKFINQIKPTVAIQLDVIGDHDKTWANYQHMSKQCEVIPVIHYGAPDKHIKRVCAASPYVLLGGLVPYTRKPQQLKAWLDFLYSKHSLRDHKIHALGVTTKWCLERYPFYSVDSSSALSVTRYPSSHLQTRVAQKTKHYSELYKYGIAPMLKLEQHVTRLWEKRGIVWED